QPPAGAPSPPPRSTPMSLRPSAVPPKSSRSPRSATTFRNCAPKDLSPNYLARGAINCSRAVTRSAWSSSNCLSASTLLLPPVSLARSKAMSASSPIDDLSSTASTNALSTTSTTLFTPSASKKPPDSQQTRTKSALAPLYGLILVAASNVSDQSIGDPRAWEKASTG